MAGTRAPRRQAALSEYRRKRDFHRTAEPAGEVHAAREGALAFVVQKHAARALHYDLRLELDGVMKSWAVPKGPSPDPAVRRMAVEVEDHPIDYNTFEGTIPAGEYGGGTVMLWDRGTYRPDNVADGGNDDEALREGIRKGKLSITFHGTRLRGSYALVRSRRPTDGGKAQWLLIKHDDRFVGPPESLVERHTTSVDTARTMDEIAAGAGGARVWRSNRGSQAPAAKQPARRAAPSVIQPMLASKGDGLPEGDEWTFEPKYDGIRVLGFVSGDAWSLFTRNGNDKCRQFPEIGVALKSLAQAAGRPLVLDGELVGMSGGEILRFESLQERMHTTQDRVIQSASEDAPAALVVFDLLVDGDDALAPEPWTVRRAALEALLAEHPTPRLLLGETSRDGTALAERATAAGWEGVMAKRIDARYQPGVRSRDWLKIKMEKQQELVIGGWTEPRGGRQHLGALLLGYYNPDGELVYAGHTGTGFNAASLQQVLRRLKRLERKTSPFVEAPKTNETAHWVSPRLVAEIRFNEWTSKGKLRQPVFLGLREDKEATAVVREDLIPTPEAERPAPEAAKLAERSTRRAPAHGTTTAVASVLAQLEEIEAGSGDGTVKLSKSVSIPVTHLAKVFWPDEGYTKGDLLRYYAAMSPLILPAMKDRPLSLQRWPNGIGGKAFYQQTPDVDAVPAGVRVETIRSGEEEYARLVGGDLATLLYTVQLGAISYDPWHSRIHTLAYNDYSIIDLDPGEGTHFRTVIEVARAVREDLDGWRLHGALKTSGSRGLHIYIPLPKKTPVETATLLGQLIATGVAQRMPGVATIERSVRKRPSGSVYVDFLQNPQPKTVSGVYAVRAKPGATVSTPLRWEELTDELTLADYTIRTVPERVAEVGDPWGEAMRKSVSLNKILSTRRSR